MRWWAWEGGDGEEGGWVGLDILFTVALIGFHMWPWYWLQLWPCYEHKSGPNMTPTVALDMTPNVAQWAPWVHPWDHKVYKPYKKSCFLNIRYKNHIKNKVFWKIWKNMKILNFFLSFLAVFDNIWYFWPLHIKYQAIQREHQEWKNNVATLKSYSS